MALYPLVSLICVVKNGMPYLPEAIKSVQNQTYRNFELIIQDGKSTDGTVDFIKSLKGIKNIQVHSQLDKNLAQGWNRVLAKCSGEIIGSIDADNLLKKESLEAIVKLFKKYPKVPQSMAQVNSLMVAARRFKKIKAVYKRNHSILFD